MKMKPVLHKFRDNMRESKNTLGADINEILFGYIAAGNSWDRFVNGDEAEQALLQRQAQVTPEEFQAQQGRALAMFDETMNWADENGWEGNIINVWWTARPGVLSQAVGTEASAGNPTDILLQFSGGEFLGISAKSTKSSGDIGFKNPGVRPVGASLGIDLLAALNDMDKIAIESMGLPRTAKERKKFLRAVGNEELRAAAEKIGATMLNTLRAVLLEHISNMSQEDIRQHILDVWMDAKDNYPYYIKVTGRGGGKKDFSASISDPVKNEKYKALMSDEITLQEVGSDSIGVMAGGKRVMKMRFKFESQKLASSLKMSGDPW